MTIDLTRFHESFFSESVEGLDATEAHLLALEGSGEAGPARDERLNAVFRGFHSIKGAAGSLGFRAISDFTHHVEEFLDHWRKGKTAIDRTGLDTMLACVDHARGLLRAAKEGSDTGGERSAYLVRQLGMLSRKKAAAAESASPADATTTYRIRFKPGRDSFRQANDPLRLLRLLGEMGTLSAKADLAAVPPGEDFDPECCYLAWDLELVTRAPPEQVEEVFAWVRDTSEVKIEVSPRRPSPSERRRTDRRQSERRTGPRRSEEAPMPEELRTDRLHVSRDKIDEMVNLVGELVITKTMMKQVAQSLDAPSAARFEDVLAQLERNTRDLQSSVMGVRMLPISHAFGRFPRLVRDTSQQLGKEVRLEVTGG